VSIISSSIRLVAARVIRLLAGSSARDFARRRAIGAFSIRSSSVTDRKVLDRQLQTTVRQFEQTLGIVENIDKTGAQLKEALEAGKTIIVSTLQKYPVIAKEIGTLRASGSRSSSMRPTHRKRRDDQRSQKGVSAVNLEEAAKEKAQTSRHWRTDRRGIKARGRLLTFPPSLSPRRQAEDFGIIRDQATRWKVRAISSTLCDRQSRRSYPRCAPELHHAQSFLKLLKKIKDDPAYDRDKGELPAQAVCRSARAFIRKRCGS